METGGLEAAGLMYERPNSDAAQYREHRICLNNVTGVDYREAINDLQIGAEETIPAPEAEEQC